MSTFNFKRRSIKSEVEESITYHFGDDKKIPGKKRPDLESNQEFVYYEKEEEEIEFESILPDIKEEIEEDPLKIDDIKPEIDSETDKKSIGYIIWSVNRRKELLKSHSEQKPKNIEDISNNVRCNNTKVVQEKLNVPTSIHQEQQKTKGTRYTAYTLWCKEMRRFLLNNHPDLTFGEISTILGKKWKLLKSQEKYVYQNRARQINEKTIQFKEKEVIKSVKKRKSTTLGMMPLEELEEEKKISRKGRIISKPTKLADFYNVVVKRKKKRKKSETSNLNETSDQKET